MKDIFLLGIGFALGYYICKRGITLQVNIPQLNADHTPPPVLNNAVPPGAQSIGSTKPFFSSPNICMGGMI